MVVVGSGGRLGAALCNEYRARHHVTGFARRDLDLCDLSAVRRALDPLEFDALINCAALTNVDHCEDHRQEAFLANAAAVGIIGEICAKKGARCIHISTDYVFSGEAAESYAESDPALPINVYGESKLAGEDALLAASSDHLVVRVSWLFGPDRPSFVDKILERALTLDHVEAIGDKYSSPTYSLDLAASLELLLANSAARGLLHLCNRGGCSWQQFGQWALDCAIAAGVPMQSTKVDRLTLGEMKSFVARRPVNTVLATESFQRLSGHHMRSWQAAVEDYVVTCFAPRHLVGDGRNIVPRPTPAN